MPGYSGGATMAFAGDELVVAWSELETPDFGERPAFTASSAAGFAPERRTPEAGADVTSTRLAADGGVVHLVFSGPGASDEENILYMRRTGGAWSEPVDLSGPLETGARRDTEPVVLAAGGEVAVIYLSAPADDVLAPGVHMVRFADGGSPSAVEMLVDSAGADCETVDAAVDGEGVIHVAAACAFGAGAPEILYINNRSGSFVTQSASLGAGTEARNPAIAVGANRSVHLVWDAEADCGDQVCRDVFYSRDLAPPISVTGGSQDGGGFARIAALPGGELVAVFHRTDAGDLYWTYAESGQTFVRVLAATPSTPDTLEYLIGDIEVDAAGRPHMVFIRDFAGSDPIQADVYAAALR